MALKFRVYQPLAFRDEPVTVGVFSLNTRQQVGTEAFIPAGSGLSGNEWNELAGQDFPFAVPG